MAALLAPTTDLADEPGDDVTNEETDGAEGDTSSNTNEDRTQNLVDDAREEAGLAVSVVAMVTGARTTMVRTIVVGTIVMMVGRRRAAMVRAVFTMVHTLKAVSNGIRVRALATLPMAGLAEFPDRGGHLFEQGVEKARCSLASGLRGTAVGAINRHGASLQVLGDGDGKSIDLHRRAIHTIHTELKRVLLVFHIGLGDGLADHELVVQTKVGVVGGVLHVVDQVGFARNHDSRERRGRDTSGIQRKDMLAVDGELILGRGNNELKTLEPSMLAMKLDVFANRRRTRSISCTSEPGQSPQGMRTSSTRSRASGSK